MQDVLKLFRQEFNHDGQAGLCASHLELLRKDLAGAWWEFPKEERKRTARRGSPNWVEGPWTREQMNLAGHLIRHAGESADYPATVDFITKGTAGHIKASLATSKRRTIGNLKQWELFTHEHMVPGQAVLRVITDADHPESRGELQPLLAALNLRALVTGTKRKRPDGWTPREIDALEPRWASVLPEPSDISGWNGHPRLHDVPARFYGLMRYEAAGLLDSLIPVSGRAGKVLAEYFAYRGRTPAAAGQSSSLSASCSP
ncbi:hypothetical protein [Massilia endophytica]|uniref:hypothetical protein n=1 Tax=Massilia endophytica TaxID=2899220 RepID=UPI001E4E5572|nr:hypothetical protein [Massilia endophytica]UGQ47818.1 hypothetical protein LSQ66_04925 [Massilia endophytica]